MGKEPTPKREQTRQRRIEDIFEAALDVPPEELPAFLDEACAGDHELRREVEELLEFQGVDSPGLLPTPGLAELHPSLQELSIAPGMHIGRYQIVRRLGKGGMGTVFLARDTRLPRRVALKFLHAATRTMTERFLAEAEATARCKHANIVIIHDVEELDGHPYMVLEYLEGEPLRQRLGDLNGAARTAAAIPAARRREATPPAMPAADALALVIPMVRALVCAHAHGIIHRDLKPENVFLCNDGTVKVLDFGIAKVLADTYGPEPPARTVAPQSHSDTLADTLAPRGPVVTEQGALLGTLPYMAPEQWGVGEIDERTDLWAVGVMLYEMLAGRHPLAPVSYSKLEKQVPDLDVPMPALGAALPDLEPDLAEIVDGCLRKRKAERVTTAQELLDALERVQPRRPDDSARPAPEQTEAASAEAPADPGTEDSPEAPDPAPRRRRRLAAAALGVGLAALLVVGLWPRLSIPALPQGAGGVVVSARAGDALGPTHQALCAALRDLDAQAVRCVEQPRFGVDQGDVASAAARAGASLIAHIEGDHDLRLVPVNPSADLWSELPTLHIADADPEQLAGILHPLARAMAGDLRFDALRTPPVTADQVGWRLAALAWYLDILARAPQAIPPADLRRTMTRCRQEVSLADTSCALVHYIYTQLDPTPPDTGHWLQALLDHGPPAFADLAVIEQAADDCARDPERAQAAVLHLAARWSGAPCRRLALVGPAACLLTRHDSADPALEPIAYPGDAVMGSCEADLAAAALAERGQWNMLARDWPRAARDFDAAWKRGNHPADLLNWAESLLHQRPDTDGAGAEGAEIDVAGLIAAGLDLRYFDDELRPLAAYLRWLATGDADDAASLLGLYSQRPLHASALVDDAGTLASLVCAHDEARACQVYRVLSRAKQAGSEDELRRLLLAGDQR